MIGKVFTATKYSDSRSYNPVTILLAISVLIFMLSLAFNIVTTARQSHVKFIEVDIKEGDTIWEFVREINGDSADIREAVAVTIKVNGLEDRLIQPGTIIKIPQFVNVERAEASNAI